MAQLLKLAAYVKPCRLRALLALVLLTLLVFLELAIPRLIQRIIDRGIAAGDSGVVWETALWMAGISLLSMLFALGNNSLSVEVAERVARDLRERLFTKIQTFSHADLDRHKTGELLVRLTGDTGAVMRLVLVSLRIGTRAPLMMVGSLALMVATSPGLALLLLPLLLVASLLIVLFVIRMEPLFLALQRKLERLNIVLQENIAGARLVRAFVRAGFEAGRFGRANREYTELSTRVLSIASTMSPLLSLCVSAGVVVVVWAGGLRAIGGEMTLGEVVAFVNYLLMTMTPLVMMTILSNVWAGGIVSAGRINELLETIPGVREAPDAIPLPGPAAGGLRFERVSFGYGGPGAEPVLSGIQLAVEPGQTVALLGETGAGKSTLVNLVPRFYDVTSGRILLDGIDLRRLTLASLTAAVAVVPQETVLFSGSVRENIRYGLPGAGDDEVRAAAQAAAADEFIRALPDGYDTPIGERGATLSGGQRQRIAIARALLLRPRILILDDCTSAVDLETERRIHRALAEIRPRPTTLVVAQRVTSARNADRIVVLDRGRIVADGSHAELIAASPVYREIFASQLGAGVMPEAAAAGVQPGGGAPDGGPEDPAPEATEAGPVPGGDGRGREGAR